MTRRLMLRVLSGLAVLGIALLGMACDGDDGETGASGTRTGGAGGEKPVVGVSIPAATHGWPAGLGWWAEQTIAKHADVEWRFQRAANANEQVSQIETMLEQGIDALVVLPFDSGTPMNAVKRAKEREVFVVSVDRGLKEPIADVYVAGDNRAFGRQSAEYMVEKLGGSGKIVILRGIPTEIDTERYESAMEVFEQNDGIEVLGAQAGNWNREQAHRVMQDFLTKHPQIDAVWASDDDMALGVEQAIKEAGRESEMWVMGGAGMNDIVERVMKNDPMFPADITYPPGMIAAGIEIAAAHVKEGDIVAAAEQIPEHLGVTKEQLEEAKQQQGQKRVTLDVFLITPENAEKYYFPDSVY